ASAPKPRTRNGALIRSAPARGRAPAGLKPPLLPTKKPRSFLRGSLFKRIPSCLGATAAEINRSDQGEGAENQGVGGRLGNDADRDIIEVGRPHVVAERLHP